MKKILIFCFVVLAIQSCQEREISVPKQRGYFRIDLPEHKYSTFCDKNYPYSFNIPNYAKMEKDTEAGSEPYWINIQFPQMNATIHLSYKQIHNNFDEIVEDVHYLAFKHEVRADGINTKEFHYDEKNVHGLLFDIKGDAASLAQFFITDSSQNFLRGALYFNVPPNKDSLAPVIDFIREDIIEMISSFSWQKK